MFAGAPVLLRGYGVETDWRALAAYDQNVKLAADGCVDWNQSGARLTVAKALLSRDFGLPQWDMPPERLCPCVPNRVAYIAWIADLLDDDDEGGTADGADSVCAGGAARSVRGIDIGTGASCIYALLGARARGWRFVATDSDADAVVSARVPRRRGPTVAVAHARGNVSRHGLEGVVDVRHTPVELQRAEAVGPLRAAVKGDEEFYDFSMTNPPFFASEDERSDAAGGQARRDGACEMLHSEMVTAGGEAAFVGAIIEDSLNLGPQRVRWNTALIGRRKSLRAVLADLRERKSAIDRIATTRFRLGETTRWCVAWTVRDEERSTEGAVRKRAAGADDFKVFGAKKALRREASKRFDFEVDDRLERPELETRITEFFEWYAARERFDAAPWIDNEDDTVSSRCVSPSAVVSVTLRFFDAPHSPTVALVLEGVRIDAFQRLCQILPAEINRSNRRWRRSEKREIAAVAPGEAAST